MAERAPGRFDGLAVAIGLGVVYLVCAPGDLHAESLAVLGLPSLPAAAADTGLAAALRGMVAAFAGIGVGTHAAASILSALAAAVAVWCGHGAAREFGCERRRALATGVFVGTCPAAATAATMIHTHAFVLAVAAGGLWLAVATARRGSMRLAAALGVVSGLAHAATPVGALVPVAVLPWVGFARGAAVPARRALVLVAAALVIGLTIAAALLRLRLTEGMPAWEAVRAWDVGTLLPIVLRDAARSYLPLSLVVLAAIWSRTHHRPALAVLAGVVGAVLLGCHTTATLGDDGSFVLPFLPAAAVLAASWLPVRMLLVVVLAGTGVAGTKLALRVNWHADAQYVAGVRQVSAGRACRLLMGPRRDEAVVLRCLPEVTPERLLPYVAPAPSATPEQLTAQLIAAARAGQCVVITEEAQDALRDPFFRSCHPGSAALLRQLEAAFTWRAARIAGFAGHELVPK